MIKNSDVSAENGDDADDADATTGSSTDSNADISKDINADITADAYSLLCFSIALETDIF